MAHRVATANPGDTVIREAITEDRMKSALEHGYIPADRLNSLYTKNNAPVRDLGLAILVVAIADYRGGDEQLHRDAARFLYPQTATRRRHYEWAVDMQNKVTAEWLRGHLDRARPEWDAQRMFVAKPAARGQRRKSHEERVRLDDWKLHNWHKVAAGVVGKPAHTEGVARASEAAAGL